VAEAAKGGEVLVTETVRDSVRTSLPTVTFGRLRRRRFKGLEPVGVCPVGPAGVSVLETD
jgi:class 3 adenylate cyclase